LNSLETSALDCLNRAVTLMCQGSLCDAGVVIDQVKLSDGTPVADLMAKMSELVRRLTAELCSKESALATVQTAMWELETAKEALRTSEARFRTTLASIGDGLITTDLRGCVNFMNRVAQQLTGWTSDDAMGRPITEVFRIVHAQTRTEAVNPTERALSEGVVVGLANHTLLIARDGTERHIADSCAPIHHEGGQIFGAVLVFRDVTDEYHRREQLRASEDRYRELFQGSRDGITTIAPPSWKFTSCNAAALKMFGVETEAEFIRLGPWDVSPTLQPDGRSSVEAAQEAIEKTLRQGANSFLWLHRTVNGDTFHASVLLARTEIGGNNVVQATVRDESARLRLESELEHARKLEAVGQLAAGIAHEINTPAQYVGDGVCFLREVFDSYRQLFNKYRAIVETLQGGGVTAGLVEEIREMEEEVDLDYIEANVPGSFDRCLDGISRISTIVRAMKEFSHPDQREKSPADLNQALQNTLVITRNEYKYVADIVTELGELPMVMCHVSDLSQIFLNLIVNAAHAIEDVVGKGGEKGQIRINSRREGEWVLIDIMDTGSGVPESIRDRIFEPFFTTKAVGRGSGQGLAIARSIVVDKHCGTLTFDSELGKGTTFTIRLPIDGRGEKQRAMPG
jgi:two-component system, NtrC family, sensor kinase